MKRNNDDTGRAAVRRKRRAAAPAGQHSPEDRVEALQAENARLREELEACDAALARASTDLERAERATQRFFAGASHQLRTPLNAVICYGELLAGSVLGRLNGRQRDAVERLCTAGWRLTDLVDALLELSRLQSGTIQPEAVTTDLGWLAEGVVGSLEEEAEERDVRLVFEGRGEEVVADTDPELTRRILWNLCVTALKLTRGGDVRVRLRKTSVGPRIEVSDDGPGIPAAERPRTFKAFEFTGSPNQGVGLELAIAGEAASLVGARVTTKARRGRGSTFTLHLPDRAPALVPG